MVFVRRKCCVLVLLYAPEQQTCIIGFGTRRHKRPIQGNTLYAERSNLLKVCEVTRSPTSIRGLEEALPPRSFSKGTFVLEEQRMPRAGACDDNAQRMLWHGDRTFHLRRLTDAFDQHVHVLGER